MLQVPEEFQRLTRCFVQGSLEEATDVQKWIEQAVQLAGREHHAVIKSFLTEILQSHKDGAELQRIWAAGSPSYAIWDANELRQFLTQIRNSIE